MTNTIDIEVNLDSKKALKGLDKLEGAGEAVGESFNTMGSTISALGGEVNEKLGAMGESVGALSGSFKNLSQAAMGPGASFTALLGPIGAVAIGIIELSKAFDEYSGKAQEAEIRVESYKAATAELTSVVEELAAAQVKLNGAQIDELKNATMRAKVPLERAQLIREANARREEEIHTLRERLQIEEEAFKRSATIAAGYTQGALESSRALSIQKRINKLRQKINQEEKRAISLTIIGAQETVKLEKKKESLLKQSPKFKKEQAEREKKIQEQAQIDSLQSAKKFQFAQIEMAKIQSSQKIREIEALEDISEQTKRKAILAEQKRLQSQILDIEESFAEKRRLKSEARRKEIEAREKAAAIRLQSELFQIRSLEIQQMQLLGAKAEEIINARYELELQRAGETQNQQLIARMKFELAMSELVKSQEAEREKARLDAFEKSQATLKKLRDSVQDQIDQVGEFASTFGGAFADAAFGAVFMGESIKESIAQIIFGLGKEAAVRSLMETAKGFASLVLNPAVAASHFKAAGLFAGLAATAGGVGMAMSGKGSSGGGGGSSSSPSGSSQIAPAPTRERSEETNTVFNINFSGAVIYDSKQAAERAMVDRLIQVMNQRNRGSRRLNTGAI